MSHPLQNRVDPWSDFHANPSRLATRMGNRGILHNEKQEIVRAWKSKAWVCCRMQFNGIQRTVFQVEPKLSYSELFFLDEAVALAVGHRPCNDCQRDRLKAFKLAWCAANRSGTPAKEVLISEIDDQLHNERTTSDRRKVTFDAPAHSLPVGSMFAHDRSAFLVTSAGLYLWSFNGYTRASPPASETVKVLTPQSIVATLREGYVPAFHPSVDS